MRVRLRLRVRLRVGLRLRLRLRPRVRVRVRVRVRLRLKQAAPTTGSARVCRVSGAELKLNKRLNQRARSPWAWRRRASVAGFVISP
tara:strand:+ start:120 stop:380 length:261 start_codon:yes stop_codon:yes gene_type:complete|eukprot:scaffold75036_cov69-Phaeocystis_antarctica.AAC.2